MTPNQDKLSGRLALGIDIGGTSIKSLVVQSPGTILAEWETSSDAKSGPEAVRLAVARTVNYFIHEGLKPEVVGIGCAGSVDHEAGMVRRSPNFSGWENVCLVDWLREDFGLTAVVENDANCAVVAEWKMGAGKGSKNIVLLTIGTGIGGGLVLNDQVYRGSTGTAGELGHFTIDSFGPPGAFGLPGTFELNCSATALLRETGMEAKATFAEVASNPGSNVAPAFTRFLHSLKVSLTSVANIFDPDVILLGGAVSRGLEGYLPELRTWICDHTFPTIASHLRLELAVHGNRSGSLGAALLALDGSVKPTK